MAGDLVDEWDLRRALHPARADVPGLLRAGRGHRPQRGREGAPDRGPAQGRGGRLRRARGGARRRDDARSSSASCCSRSSTSAGASTCTTWTTCARASTCAAFAQIDPLVAYKNEGFEMFTGLMNAIWEEFARYIFNVEVQRRGRGGRAPPGRGRSAAAPARPAASPTTAATPRPAARRSRQRPGRRGAALADPELGGGAPAGAADRAAPPGRARADRPQRSVLVRQRQEVQEVPWRLAYAPSATS